MLKALCLKIAGTLVLLPLVFGCETTRHQDSANSPRRLAGNSASNRAKEGTRSPSESLDGPGLPVVIVTQEDGVSCGKQREPLKSILLRKSEWNTASGDRKNSIEIFWNRVNSTSSPNISHYRIVLAKAEEVDSERSWVSRRIFEPSFKVDEFNKGSYSKLLPNIPSDDRPLFHLIDLQDGASLTIRIYAFSDIDPETGKKVSYGDFPVLGKDGRQLYRQFNYEIPAISPSEKKRRGAGVRTLSGFCQD